MTVREHPDAGPLSAAAFESPRAIGRLPPCRRLAVGTAALGGHYGPVDEAESVRVLHAAWAAGFGLVDTAPHYTAAQAVLARALREWTGTQPVVLTKLEGYPAYAPPGFAADWESSMEKQLAASEALLGPRVIRGVAMHDPEYAAPDYADACHRYLLRQAECGRVAELGLGGGGPVEQSKWLPLGPYRYVITHRRLAAVTLQALGDLVPLCRSRDVRLLAASPLYAGLLGAASEAGRLPALHDAPPVVFERARAVRALAAQSGIPMAQLALRFLLSLPAVDFVPVGPRNFAEWRDALAAYEAGPLGSDLFRRISEIARTGEEIPHGG
jgi:aryl-alcohol dehydrogenase-like predicted oxidoreductase